MTIMCALGRVGGQMRAWKCVAILPSCCAGDSLNQLAMLLLQLFATILLLIKRVAQSSNKTSLAQHPLRRHSFSILPLLQDTRLLRCARPWARTSKTPCTVHEVLPLFRRPQDLCGDHWGAVIVCLQQMSCCNAQGSYTKRTWKEHISVSSTLIMAPALSNSPQ